MIIALQTLVFFRHTLLAVLDRILRPYYTRLIFSFKNNGPVCEEDDSDDQVYSEFDKEKGVVFFPPMYVQRYAAVSDCLMDERWCGRLQKVADLGYCDMSFIKYLKDVPGVQTILGVDVEKVPLRCAWDLLGCNDYPFKSDNALHVLLLQGNAADPDYRLIGCDAVVAIEMIEHMLPHDLERLIHTIFGFIKPMVAIITTPNKDFNELFKNMGQNGMRHWDHRFEWTREQFNDWCSNIVERYPNYLVMCKGVGPGPPGTQHLGCCSQLALFSAKHYQKQQDLNLNSLRVLVSTTADLEGNNLLDLCWEDPSDSGVVHTPSDIPDPRSLSDLRDEQSIPKIPVKLSNSTIHLPMISYRDKMLQCNLPVEAGKNFMMFSDEQEYCWTLLPRRRGDGDFKVYEIEDVVSRLNCTTLQVKKFSKATQKLFANNKMDTLSNTRQVVEEIKNLTKMLNFTRNISNEDMCTSTWANINWGDNAPFWNQYYTVVREFKYPFETKSEESLMLELISDEINSLADTQYEGGKDASTLEVSLAHLMKIVQHITTDEDRVRDLLEWNGYEVKGDTVIHHRSMIVPDDESEDDHWQDNGSSDWDVGSDHSGASSKQDLYGHSLRRAFDRKVRKLRAMNEADMDISSELDAVVFRLMKLALRMTNGCQIPLHPRWLQRKLYDLLSLTEKSVGKRKMRHLSRRCLQAIEYGMEEERSQRLALVKEKDDSTVKRIEDKYRHFIQFKDKTEEFTHSPTLGRTSPAHDLHSEFGTESPCLITRGAHLEEDLKLSPTSSSAENYPQIGRKNYWSTKGSVGIPFVHRPPECENSTDDTDPKKVEVRQKSPTKKKRNVVFPDETTKVDVTASSQHILSDHSGKRKTKNKKDKNAKVNRKVNQKSSYNTLIKNYSIHKEQADNEYDMSFLVARHTEQPTSVKPIPCSLMDLCYEGLSKKNSSEDEWSQLEDAVKAVELKETDLATEEMQIMSFVMDDVVGLQDNFSPNDTIKTSDTYHVCGVGENFDISKNEENVTSYSAAVFLSDFNEPSTSKGICHVNMDAQCGPDTITTECPLLTHTPSIKLQKMYKSGIYIVNSSTEINADAKEIVNYAASTSENTKEISNDTTKNTSVQIGRKNVSSTMTETFMTKTKVKNVSTATSEMKYQMPSPGCAVETTFKAVFNNNEKADDSLSDHSAVCASSLQNLPFSVCKVVNSADTSTHGICTLYDRLYKPPKLSFVGAHVHSYRERELSEDILYQGIWQQNRTKEAPKKRWHSDITTKKLIVTKKHYSKEKLQCVRPAVKNCSNPSIKRTAAKPSTSKDFIYKNIVMAKSGNEAASKVKKMLLTKKATSTKSKPNIFNMKASLVSERKNPVVGPIVIDRIRKIKETIPPDVALAKRKTRVIPTDVDKIEKKVNITHCLPSKIMKEEPEKEKVLETHPKFTSEDVEADEVKAKCNDATVIASYSDLRPGDKSDCISINAEFAESHNNSTFAYTSVDTKPYFSNHANGKENFSMDNKKSAEGDPEFMSNFQSLAKLKQDIISSNEVLARLQHDFEQKVEKQILGSKARKNVNRKHSGKIPSKSSLSTETRKIEKTRPTKSAASKFKTVPPLRPKTEPKKIIIKPVKNSSKTLLKKTSPKNLGTGKVQQKMYPASNVTTTKRKLNFKESQSTTRSSSATPTPALAKSPLRTQQSNKTQLKSPMRPRSADGTVKRPIVTRQPTKRAIWMPKQSTETQKLTKDLLQAHDKSSEGHNYHVYCSELDNSDSILFEDPDMAIKKYYSSSSRTSSNCSSPNSVVTVRSRLQRSPNSRQSSPVKKILPNTDYGKRNAQKITPQKKKYNTVTYEDDTTMLRSLAENAKGKPPSQTKKSRTDYDKNIFVAQLSPETSSPLQNSPTKLKSLSPVKHFSPTRNSLPSKSILIITDIDETNVKFIDSDSLPEDMPYATAERVSKTAYESTSNIELGENTRVVALLESKFCEDLTNATYNEICSAMRELIENTLEEIDKFTANRILKWPDVCAKTSSSTAKKKQSDCSQKKESKILPDISKNQRRDIRVVDSAKESSIKDLYERKEQLTFKPAGPLAIQAFSGFSMNSPPTVGDQKPDFINLIDSSTGSITTGIPTRLAASEELYISGRSSESYQSCMVDDEMVVPEWLFRIVSQHREEYENQYDDDEENYPMPMPIGVPVAPVAFLEPGLDLNGNVVEGVPTIPRTGAGDGRGIHSDQSQDSSGQGTSLTTSTDSSGPQSTSVMDASAFPSRYDSLLESMSDEVTEAESSRARPGRQRTSEAATPMSSTERIYTLLNQTATSDVDADVSSIDTDDNVSRGHDL